MQRHEALALLGLGEPFEPHDLRAAYRRAARRLHPDRPDAPADATERMASINLAHALLSDPSAPASSAAPTATPPGAAAGPAGRSGWAALDVQLFDDGSLLIDAPTEETFERLVDAIEAIGDPTYVDADAGLLQIIVSHDGGPFGYLTFSLQGRATGTEIFTTIERLDSVAALDAWPLLVTLADSLRRG